MKSAMGNPVRLTAPRFVHSYQIQPDQKSEVEIMHYDFFVAGANNGRERLTTRDAVLGKFGDAAFPYFDGTSIDPDLWDKWIPIAGRLSLKSGSGQSLNSPHPVNLTLGNLIITTNSVLTFAWGLVPFDIEPLPYHGFTPTDDTAKFGVLDQQLPQIAKYQDTHKYPVFKCWGFKNLSDFIRGWNWTVKLINGKLKFISAGLVCVAFRRWSEPAFLLDAATVSRKIFPHRSSDGSETQLRRRPSDPIAVAPQR
jgi:hypothetical protein